MARSVLWTSGWDSTYMILRMLREETVQPIYIINPRRKSRFIEMEALSKLEKKIREQIPTGKLLTVKKYDLRDIEIKKDIRKALKQINKVLKRQKRRPIGYQYEYLASFAEKYHKEYPIISVGVEKVSKTETGGLATAIQLFGEMTPDFRVDKNKSQEAIVKLLGNFDFPIIDTTEPEMLKNIHEWHYEDIMKEIWFCHKPINGKACGFCSPCFQKGISGMSFLLSETAQHRFRRFKKIENKYGRQAKKIVELFYRLTQPK